MAKEAVDPVTAAAERCLEEGGPASCLALLPGVPSPQRQQLQALCHILLATTSKPSSTTAAWWKVGGLSASGGGQ